MDKGPKLGESVERQQLGLRLKSIRGDTETAPDLSVVIPVNAQGDLKNVLMILDDIAGYQGTHCFEILLVVNNYPPDSPPSEIESLQALGTRVVAIPDVRKPGEAVGFTARIPGIREAATQFAILFDADCKVPNSTALIDWYYEQLSNGAYVAYTHVGYFELLPLSSVKFRVFTHHASRWFKRSVLGIPTTRGSNYAVNKTQILSLYDSGMLADEMNVGPNMKKRGGRVAYSSARELTVLTSGRMFTGGWLDLARYLIYRLKYNLRVLPVSQDVASRTGREKDSVRRYVNNRQVADNDVNDDGVDQAGPKGG